MLGFYAVLPFAVVVGAFVLMRWVKGRGARGQRMLGWLTVAAGLLFTVLGVLGNTAHLTAFGWGCFVWGACIVDLVGLRQRIIELEQRIEGLTAGEGR